MPACILANTVRDHTESNLLVIPEYQHASNRRCPFLANDGAPDIDLKIFCSFILDNDNAAFRGTCELKAPVVMIH